MAIQTSGTLAGLGTFRCHSCGESVALAVTDTLPVCPECGEIGLSRASLLGSTPRADDAPTAEMPDLLQDARRQIDGSGEYLVFSDAGATRVVELDREWTRIGRSLAADIRFDDATVSRRHALIVRQSDGVRVLDDRSLNGVFVNGQRVEWSELRDGDELLVGRHRLRFLAVQEDSTRAPVGSNGTSSA